MIFMKLDREILPPATSPEKTIFLDLDKTLVHSTKNPDIPPANYDFVVRVESDLKKNDYYVLKRPHVDEFLDYLSENFEIVIFTAGTENYASLVLDKLDPKSRISHRLYRDSCIKIDSKYIKDLSEIGRDLENSVIVDDNPISYFLQPDNGIPIKPFVDDLCDVELKKLIKFFDDCCHWDVDMRDAVRFYLLFSRV